MAVDDPSIEMNHLLPRGWGVGETTGLPGRIGGVAFGEGGPITPLALHHIRMTTGEAEQMKLTRAFAVTALSVAVAAGGVTTAGATAAGAAPKSVSSESSSAPSKTSPFTSNALRGGKVPSTQDTTELSATQIDNARTIIAVGKGAKLSKQAQTIAVMTALQESSLLNLDGGDKDSAGLFQQRPSMEWGTLAQVTDPIYASKAFYGVNPLCPNPGLLQIQDWKTMTLGEAAQDVQRSAYPDAYDKWESLATQLVDDNQDVDPIA